MARRWDLRRRRRRNEKGAIAVLVGLLSLVLFMMAALSVDIGLQINKKHQLFATLDSAAQAGASQLPGSTATAKSTALKYAKVHDNTATGTNAPNVDFWCVVGSTGTSAPYAVDTTQMPSTCYPGPAPYTVGSTYQKNGDTSGRKITCSAKICAIPCYEPTSNTGTPKVQCNTIRVYSGRDVPFSFAPAGGINKGYTGDLASVACKGSCGTVAPNPLDVAVVADRTLSMSDTDVSSMISGIKGMLQQMTPDQQYVALGTIGRSQSSTGTTSGTCSSRYSNALSYPSPSKTSGAWVPVGFSNNYASTKGTLDNSSTLVKAVNCLSNQSETDTFLASPVKAAARYLLGYDSNNLSSLPTRPATVTKVLILETDGQPNESAATTGTTSLGTPGDVFSSRDDTTTTSDNTGDYSTRDSTVRYNGDNYSPSRVRNRTITLQLTGGQTACNNLASVLQQAKAAGVLVITIAYNMTGNNCGDYDGSTTQASGSASSSDTSYDGRSNGRYLFTNTTTTYYKNANATDDVLSVLAAGASNTTSGQPSTASNNCSTDALRAVENADGDYFFCAASGDNMSSIFTTAVGQVSSGIKLLNLP